MITRRRVLEAMGACVLSPAMSQGPFFVEENLNRSDITPGATGVPLVLDISVANARADCAPLAGVRVDIWHADARGEYSAVGAARGKQFLRGYQMTDAHGKVAFRTLYPGWYPGRAVHIHVKTPALTTQLFFDEAVTERVIAIPPYNTRGARFMRNARDGIFREGRTGSLLVDLTPRDRGYAGRATLVIDA